MEFPFMWGFFSLSVIAAHCLLVGTVFLLLPKININLPEAFLSQINLQGLSPNNNSHNMSCRKFGCNSDRQIILCYYSSITMLSMMTVLFAIYFSKMLNIMFMLWAHTPMHSECRYRIKHIMHCNKKRDVRAKMKKYHKEGASHQKTAHLLECI